MMYKKEFSWDNETKLGNVDISEKERREVSVCELNKKQFISVQKIILAKGEWKVVANSTFPMKAFSQIAEIVANHVKEEG